MYVVLKILDKEPALPQMWVETRWEYLHQHLEWYSKYGSSCLTVARKMVTKLPASDSPLNASQFLVSILSVISHEV